MFCSLDSPVFTAETQEAIKVSSTWQSPRTRWCSPGSYKAFINKMTPSLTGLHNDCLFPPTEDPRWGGQPVDCYSCHHCQNILQPLSHPESSLKSLQSLAGHWLGRPPVPPKGKKALKLMRGINNRLQRRVFYDLTIPLLRFWTVQQWLSFRQPLSGKSELLIARRASWDLHEGFTFSLV